MTVFRIASFAIVMSFLSCVRNQTNVTLKVHVKTPEGEDINGAIVSLDSEQVGETNAFGTLSYSFKSEKEAVHKLEIVKESDSYYFASYADSKTLPKASSYEWAVDSTLYMVPKPRPTKLNLSADITATESEASSDLIMPGNVTAGSRDAGVLNGFPFLEEESSLRSEMDLTLSSAVKKNADTSLLDASKCMAASLENHPNYCVSLMIAVDA
jgi:phosphoribosylformylglycinamidine (FGAM) synthase PurS component